MSVSGKETGTAGSTTVPERKPTVVRHRSGRAGTYVVVGVVLLVVILLAVGYEARWFGGSKAAAPGACATGNTLQGNGANFIAALASTWVAHYNSQTSNVVNYVAGGSGTGITDLEQKTVDFAATEGPLSSSQAAGFSGPVLTLPVAGGTLVIIYNVAGVPAGLHLSGAVLAEIYMGKITSWNDPAIARNNSGLQLPSGTILTVHRSDAAGTTFVLSDYLSQDSPAWSSAVGKGISVSFPKAPLQDAIKGNSALLTYVQTTPNTIGYVDLTDVLASTTTTTYADMLNPSGTFVTPTAAATASAIADKSNATTFPSASGNWYNVSMVNAAGSGDYPLSTFAYFYVYQATDAGFAPTQVKSQVLVQWLHWVIGAGQSDVSALNYVPIAPTLVALDSSGIASMTFDGHGIPACT